MMIIAARGMSGGFAERTTVSTMRCTVRAKIIQRPAPIKVRCFRNWLGR